MHLQELPMHSLWSSAEQSLDLRLELIEQMQAEYTEDLESLQPRLQELMERFILNGGHLWYDSNPLLCRVVSDLEAGVSLSEAESSTDEEENENEATNDEGEYDDQDESGRLEIITDDEGEAEIKEEEEEEEQQEETAEELNNSIISEIKGEPKEEIDEANDDDVNDDDELHITFSRSQLTNTNENTVPSCVVIGPNGTVVDGFGFQQIVWTTTATATRALLSLIFSDDVLATHTLTGKPSPAFHGRERPPKMQLDPLKTADIVHCVLSRCRNANERQVRSSITSKCADTAKKYKRRDSRGFSEH